MHGELLEAAGEMLMEAGDVVRHCDLGVERDGFEAARAKLARAFRDAPATDYADDLIAACRAAYDNLNAIANSVGWQHIDPETVLKLERAIAKAGAQ